MLAQIRKTHNRNIERRKICLGALITLAGSVSALTLFSLFVLLAVASAQDEDVAGAPPYPGNDGGFADGGPGMPPPMPPEGQGRGEGGFSGGPHRGEGPGFGGRGGPFGSQGRGRRGGDGGGNGGGNGGGRAAGMGKALDIVNNFHGALEDPHNAIGLAVITLKHHYRREGDQKKVLPILEDLLKTTKDQPARNIMLFTMRQVYHEARDKEKFLAITDQILRENIAVVNAKKP